MPTKHPKRLIILSPEDDAALVALTHRFGLPSASAMVRKLIREKTRQINAVDHAHLHRDH